jgi:hypothetical protein
MMYSAHAMSAIALSIALWFGMLICCEVGRRLGIAQIRRAGTDNRPGVGVVNGAVFGMLSFLVGFSFSGAAARLDHRQSLVSAEVNAIGTAWSRIDLLAADQQTTLRPQFKRYVDVLLESYADTIISDRDLLAPVALTRAENDVWSNAIAACLTPRGEPARVLLLPSLNEMFGSVEQERLARRIHPPRAVFMILAVIALLAALFAGNGIAAAPSRSWVYMVGLASVFALSTWATLELEFPRLGVIRVESMDRALVELRALMN